MPSQKFFGILEIKILYPSLMLLYDKFVQISPSSDKKLKLHTKILNFDLSQKWLEEWAPGMFQSNIFGSSYPQTVPNTTVGGLWVSTSGAIDPGAVLGRLTSNILNRKL